MRETIEETSTKTSKLSFADALKSNIVMPDKNKQNPHIIKSKGKQDVKTKEDLNIDLFK